MQLSRIVILIAALAVLFSGPTTKAFAQIGTDHFAINIPKKTSPFAPIGEIKAVVSLSNDSRVRFTFSDQTTATPQFIDLTGPGGSAGSVSFGQEDSSSLGGDLITVTPPPGSIPVGDPARYRYEIDIQLKSNFDSNCVNKQLVDPNFYKVQISSTAATPPIITAVCVESFDGHPRPTGGNSCTVIPPNTTNFNRFEVPIPLDNSADEVATATLDPIVSTMGVAKPVPQPTFACSRTSRPPIDVVMVLDKSGSMSTQTSSGLGSCTTPPCSRMDALHSAVSDFVTRWASLPVFPLPPPLPAATPDRIGVVLFQSAAEFWQTLHGTGTPSLLDFTPTVANTITSNINNVTPGTSTSIGDGLLKAAPLLPAETPPLTGHRKVILLMSDGQQNTNSFVDGNVKLSCQPGAGPCVLPCSTPPCALPAQPLIYAVTLGPGTVLNPTINQTIATASGGFYLNTEENSNADLLSPFFLELLQNFLRFNSYDTVRLISAKAPYSAEIPVSTTSHDVEFSLMWPKIGGPLRLTVTPPGGAQPIVEESDSGFISITKPLPLPAPFDPQGDWKVSIESLRQPVAAGANTGGNDVAFNFHIMTDDAGVKSDLAVVPGDYKGGDNIRLRAKLSYFGLPILGLGPNSGKLVKVDLIKPGQSVGDMLSDSTASVYPPASNPDLHQGAEAKLFNALQNNPSPLRHDEQKDIPLFDDGKTEHGDDVAGDGIYSALYPAILPGHYNFLFSVESTDPNSVRFSRQQLRTAYVRAVPDTDNTAIQSSIQRRDRGGVLSMVMTPRFKAGPGCVQGDPKCGRMGPGWTNYFWFTAPRQTPFKATDNLDGTYTATLNFTGTTPPPVSVHFEDVLAIIGDSVTPDHLPQPLGPGNTFAHVPPGGRTSGKFALFLDAGAAIPHGTFSSAVNTGFSFNTGLEYIATSHFSVEGIFGYHHFPGTIAGNLNLYQFSVNGKSYLTNGTLRPFVNFGIGAYKFGPGPTKFGGNVGTGLLYNLTSRVGLEGAYNFHSVSTPGGATKFSTLQVGVRFLF